MGLPMGSARIAGIRGSGDAIPATSAQVADVAMMVVLLIIRRSWVRSPAAPLFELPHLKCVVMGSQSGCDGDMRRPGCLWICQWHWCRGAVGRLLVHLPLGVHYGACVILGIHRDGCGEAALQRCRQEFDGRGVPWTGSAASCHCRNALAAELAQEPVGRGAGCRRRVPDEAALVGAALLEGPVGVAAVLDAEHDDFARFLADAVQDAIGAASGGPDPGEVVAQWLADPVGLAGQCGGEELDHCGGDGLWQLAGQGAPAGGVRTSSYLSPGVIAAAGGRRLRRGCHRRGRRPRRLRGCRRARRGRSGRR